MALVPCPECTNKVSTTASRCPSCACDVEQFFRTKIAQRAVGFPIAPVAYWDPHFWYYWRCRSTRIEPAKVGWIEHGEPIIKYMYDGDEKCLHIPSPFSGIVVSSVIKCGRVTSIGYPKADSADDDKFVVVRPSRRYVPKEGQPFDELEIPGSFTPLIELINQAVAGVNLVDQLFGRGFRRLDHKGRFKTKEELLKTAAALGDVCAVWLPDWDFASETYEYY